MNALGWQHILAGCLTAGAIYLSLASEALGDENDPSRYGELNREELTARDALQHARDGEASLPVCAYAYLMSKRGSHEDARTIFETCAAHGYTQAMIWLSPLDANGMGDAAANRHPAAKWVRKAAEAGDMLGAYHYGVELLTGRGIKQNIPLGRSYIDRAANAGVKIAKTLRWANYDLSTITPDSEESVYPIQNTSNQELK